VKSLGESSRVLEHKWMFSYRLVPQTSSEKITTVFELEEMLQKFHDKLAKLSPKEGRKNIEILLKLSFSQYSRRKTNFVLENLHNKSFIRLQM
jgi:hypothetical protein